MYLQPQNVQNLLQSVWQLLLKSPLQDGEGVVATSPGEFDLIRVHARITGEWNGRVVLVCGREHAQELLATALRLPEAEVDPEMVEDLVAEILNIVTGNLKGAMPGDTMQSTPQVVTPTEAMVQRGEKCILELECRSGDDPVWLFVMESGIPGA